MIEFRDDDEKRAWDSLIVSYVYGGKGEYGTANAFVLDAVLAADRFLEARREREPQSTKDIDTDASPEARCSHCSCAKCHPKHDKLSAFFDHEFKARDL
jgi:hypothetical protein